MKPLILNYKFSILANISQILNITSDSPSEILVLHDVEIRGCFPGEIYVNSSGLCLACPTGSYSFDSTASHCLVCPPEASICYENNVILKPIYWKSAKTQTIYECSPFPESCL